MTRTGWYPASSHPARVGWYETSAAPAIYCLLDYWDGERWGDGKKLYKADTLLAWRGITTEAPSWA